MVRRRPRRPPWTSGIGCTAATVLDPDTSIDSRRTTAVARTGATPQRSEDPADSEGPSHGHGKRGVFPAGFVMFAGRNSARRRPTPGRRVCGTQGHESGSDGRRDTRSAGHQADTSACHAPSADCIPPSTTPSGPPRMRHGVPEVAAALVWDGTLPTPMADPSAAFRCPCSAVPTSHGQGASGVGDITSPGDPSADTEQHRDLASCPFVPHDMRFEGLLLARRCATHALLVAMRRAAGRTW